MTAKNSRNLRKLGAKWPSTSADIKSCEQKWPTSARNVQKTKKKKLKKTANLKSNSMALKQEEKDETNAFVHGNKQNNEILDLEREFPNGENRPNEWEIENEGGNALDGGPADPNDEKPLNVERLIHSRELLEEVLCPWEKFQQFIKLCPEDYWIKLHKSSIVVGCLVVFKVRAHDDIDADELLPFVDEVIGVLQGKIKFKNYGTFEIDSIQPHYGPIRDEDFETWLDKLINSGEALPIKRTKLRKKMSIINMLRNAISSSIFRRHFQQNAQKIFDGIVVGPNASQPILPAWIDISPIILKIEHLNHLFKLHQIDFANTLTGMCVQVELSKIKHSLKLMKLPPMMLLLNQILIPISRVTFDAKESYKIEEMKSFCCKVELHLNNENGQMICCSRLPQQMTLPSEQLIQTSLAVWRMNDISVPTFEQIKQKSKQFRNALSVGESASFPAGLANSNILPFGSNLLQKNQPQNGKNENVQQKEQQMQPSTNNQQSTRNKRRRIKRAMERAANREDKKRAKIAQQGNN